MNPKHRGRFSRTFVKRINTLVRALCQTGASLLLASPLLATAGGTHEPWTDKGSFQSAPDGDTLKVQTAKHGLVTVRLAGVDCPEHGQGYWRASKAHLVAMIGAADVTLSCYKTDRYDREVCSVATANGDLGAGLLGAGLAWHYKRYQDEQPPEQRELYARLETQARERRVGLWQEPNPMPPEACRKGRRNGEKCH